MIKPKQEDFKDPDDFEKALNHYYCDLEVENKELRNVLCFRCGRYKEEHLGACNHCRWHEGK